MNNKEIINKRYEVTDKTLRKYLKRFKSLFTLIYDDIYNLFYQLEITPKTLNNVVNSKIKRQLNNKISQWKEDGIYEGYLKYKVSQLRIYTYANVLEVLVYGTYYEKQKKINSYSDEVFKIVADDAYEQAKKECPIKKDFDDLEWDVILGFLFLYNVNKTYYEYIEMLLANCSQETFRYLLNCYQQGIMLNEQELLMLINKQLKRVVNVNETSKGETKFSGVLDDMCSSLVNEIYLYPLRNEDYIKVKFVAIIDNRTTKMCKSLDGQTFYVNRENDFTRYSDADKGIVTIKVEGLVSGVNLPPITDHYHHCRSTITYTL